MHAEGQRFESVILHKEEGEEREKGEREEATGGINTEGEAEASREREKQETKEIFDIMYIQEE